jgi:hypothetical protein
MVGGEQAEKIDNADADKMKVLKYFGGERDTRYYKRIII